ncbi:hypothetical protein LO763_01775 [Glycomyces sp. A-F 0318]|nr:hypothetical protein [Glycomyces amatae]MCD0442355.1 hypothetical protein [Glycomyces amatae]
MLNEPVGPLGNRARQKSEIASARTLLSGVGLAQLVMEVYQQAAAEASQQASAAMSDMFGSESEAAGFIRQAVNRYAPAGE